jgi:hypothetical protein
MPNTLKMAAFYFHLIFLSEFSKGRTFLLSLHLDYSNFKENEMTNGWEAKETKILQKA